jgi:hypothetical protein
MHDYFTPRVLPTVSSMGTNYLIWGNVVFFLPIFCLGPSVPSVLMACIGLISIAFHCKQCACSKQRGCRNSEVKPFMYGDMVGVLVLVLVVIALLWEHIPLVWWPLWAGPAWLYFKGDHDVSEEDYALLHGSWHVTAGIMLCALFFLKEKNAPSRKQ